MTRRSALEQGAEELLTQPLQEGVDPPGPDSQGRNSAGGDTGPILQPVGGSAEVVEAVREHTPERCWVQGSEGPLV